MSETVVSSHFLPREIKKKQKTSSFKSIVLLVSYNTKNSDFCFLPKKDS